MIEFVKANMFEYPGLDILVNTVNCVGVMGKGIALEFKRRFPAYYVEYRHMCRNGFMRPGKTIISTSHVQSPRFIVSFATKNHRRSPSELDWIEAGLKSLKVSLSYTVFNGLSVGMPALGCNNGGLEWVDVKPLIEKELAGITNRVVVFEPLEGTYEQVIHTNEGAIQTSKNSNE